VQPRLNVADVGLPGLELDPRDPVQLEQLIELQSRLTSLADRMHCPTVLLDVPPGLSPNRLRGWRARFATAFAATYHPWLVVSRQGDTERSLINIPPSAVAAGIIATRELYGRVAAGPANVLAQDVLDVTTRVSDVLHDDLHWRGVNVFAAERDGIRLTGARTLSLDPQWRQLSVRRLVSMIELSLRVGMTWAAFEPNGPELWSAVRHAIGTYLQSVWLSGGLAGASESESYFVRCDRSTMSSNDLDNGRMIAQVGIAPSEPLEFIVVELRCQDTGVTTGIGHA
jgi:phage tail sheath protein FI